MAFVFAFVIVKNCFCAVPTVHGFFFDNYYKALIDPFYFIKADNYKLTHYELKRVVRFYCFFLKQ
jgi:hypothetical protein